MKNIYEMLHDVEDVSEEIERVDLKDSEKKAVMKHLLQKRRRTGQNGKKAAGIAAAAAILLLGTGTVYAGVKHESFFDSLFGNSSKENVESHSEFYEADKEQLDEDGNPIPGTKTIVEYQIPSREYVEVDVEKAEELVGEAVSELPVKIPIGETIMTVESYLYNKDCLLVTYTLEREDGVEIIHKDPKDNETRGARFAEDSNCRYSFMEGDEVVVGRRYVDWEKSTDDKLVCSEYIMLGSFRGIETDQLEERNFSVRVMYITEGSLPEDRVRYVYYNLPQTKPIQTEMQEYFCEENGSIIQVSPIGMSIYTYDYRELDGIGISCGIDYKDGSEYLIFDENKEHYVDNTAY